MQPNRLLAVCLVLALLVAFLPAQVARATTYTVVNTDDSGEGSLRWAINQANTSAGPDTIAFNIPGAGVHTIQPHLALPFLLDDGTTIDGYSQPGAAAATGDTPAVILIEIDGSLAGNLASGIVIVSSDNLVRGLAINRFDWNGIALGSLGGITVTNNAIAGNYIGTDAAGTTALGNGRSGVFIGQGANQNVVGGTSPAERNVLSGNGWEGVGIHGSGTMSNTVVGNFIGTNASSTAALGNALYGVRIYGGARDNLVGGTVEGAGNVISGNEMDGVRIAGAGTMSNTVAGNWIGTTADGLAALGNHGSGVYVTVEAQSNTIGGSAAGRNIISGNLDHGVVISGTGTMSNTVAGNYIGVNATGTAALGNGERGVDILWGAAGNRIGGNTAEERNLISGNEGDGIQITYGAMDNLVTGNYIGVNAAGTAALGNTSGISVFEGADNIIGGTQPGQGNLISGNEGTAIRLLNPGTTGNVIAGNYIGTDASGTAAIGNGGGISIYQQACANTVGPGNVVSGNGGDGIRLDNMVTGTVIAGNLIGTNTTGTAALGNGGSGIFLNWTSGNTLGGDSPAERNVIAGNLGDGVIISGLGSTGNIVSGNYIGTDASGTAPLGNSVGVYIAYGASNNTVGGALPASRNVISGNSGPGVWVQDAETEGNAVVGNYIGVDASGTMALGNGSDGILLDFGTNGNTVGPGNVIAYNALAGVHAANDAVIDNLITQNSIHSNGGMGIDLIEGAHGGILPPAITAATVGLGTVTIQGTACPGCTVEVFSNGDTDGEGEHYIGSAVAGGGGAFTLVVGSLAEPHLTATATDAADGTSEFSAVYTATVACWVYLPVVFKAAP